MTRPGLLVIPALAILAAACGGGGGGSGPTDAPRTPEETAERFLSLWKDGEYDNMYSLISTEAQATIERQKFIERYEAITDEARITGLDYELAPEETAIAATAPPTPGEPEIPFSVTFHTSFFDDIEQENAIPLVREEVPVPVASGEEPKTREEWRVRWSPSLFFAELDDRNLVHFFTRIPRRGGIYDRNGRELAVDAAIPVVGIVPDQITDKEATIAALVQALGMPDAEVRARVEADVPSYYFVPVKSLPYGTPPEELIKFNDMFDLGVVVRDETRRVYPNGDSMAHVLGYITEVTEEQLEELAPKGYQSGDRVGAFGIEGQFERDLAGERGAVLATITPEGSISKTIAERATLPGKDITLTINLDVQKTAEASLGDRVGSIVAMDPQDNSVLALASYPRFNPNDFITGLTQEQVNSLYNDPRQPFLHRPLLAEYPPGSTFKVVTGAAGLEKGGFNTGSTFHCVPVWNKLGDEFAQKNWQTIDRGYLTVAGGLMASCNPVFFDIAATLDPIDPNILPQFARDFGYGAATGINGLDEAPGLIPDPAWKEANIGDYWYTGDAVNMAIGQGYVKATPLQIANAYSAISATGILRKPLLVKKMALPGGAASQEFTAEEVHPLPVSPGNLDFIRQGLTAVIQSTAGTSYQAWVGTSVDAAGKSGT
ncbi:MAG TPA: penicillin-binding transpeptidase domain-containing protein, partial [Dehalococcoidia bacterium]|nr:penicillin-binding transpeptidase domain-containing protein [Dehalococcoidia bacterium]